MKTLTIRGVPEPVCEALKKRAKANRRSLNQELVLLLEANAHESPPQRVDEDLLAVRELRQQWLKEPMTADEIENARQAGRD